MFYFPITSTASVLSIGNSFSLQEATVQNPHGVTFANLPRRQSSASVDEVSDVSNAGSHAKPHDLTSPRQSKKDDHHLSLPGLSYQHNNYHHTVSSNKEVNKLVLMIGSSINTSKEVSGFLTGYCNIE